MRLLLRLLGIHDATSPERLATGWTAVMFGCAMAGTAVLRPVRDQFGVVQGVARMPFLYSLTLGVTVVFTPLFWWLCQRMPSRRFVPTVLHVLAAFNLLLGLGLAWIGDFDWKAPGGKQLGELFWGYFSAFNVAVPTLVWIHAVEHFRREQALRLFGLIGVGGTLGVIVGSWLSAFLTSPSWSAAASLLLLELTALAHACSRRACLRLGAPQPPECPPAAPWYAGLQLLARNPRLLAIGGYMILLGMVATAFAVAQTELVGEQVARARDQQIWFASTEAWSQTLVLGLQLCATGRLLRRFSAIWFLCLLPVLAVSGLLVLAAIPTALAVAWVQIVRRGGQFALEKPAREALYTPFDVATKHKVKFLLDVVAFRLGDLLGAVYQVGLREAQVGGGGILVATIGLAVVWALLGIRLGAGASRPRT
ncbi:MAG: hypothetical protein IPK26_01110 [Planctomycetes bacterium]|nr:hypothetical protein [Planctomycetota bacterium]